ncbi:hypothetical protein CgunFtcFv8_017753 [Champsocephalus gunnari]|uniref:TGF-beta family profile domain-containing protein n=1 Tax=Champsocephalus gunnari TaxID=52237 RepID=A0AAN8DLJ2_CHAGU|nr:hypothetical protein CgunFtcFv8_017753 [Champsocephalus gunnari]
MEKQMLISAVLRYFRMVFLLLLVNCSCPLVGSASNALHKLGDFTYPYSSIFSPLLKALSEHGGSRWNQELKKNIKPDHRYIKYLTEVYSKSSRLQRSLDGNKIYNTLRLIKPKDECQAKSYEESFMQDHSYSLDQVGRKEQLLKSTLLYSFDHDLAAPVNSVCYLSLEKLEHLNQCPLCPRSPRIHHAGNFTVSAAGGSRRNWVEVDVTSFLRPLLRFHKKNIHLHINVTCPGERKARYDGRIASLNFTLNSPLLLLYLYDTSNIDNQRFLDNSMGQRPETAGNTFHKQMAFKTEQRIGRKRRWKRESPKSKQADKSLELHLPELLSSSEFPTSHCALYDFRVRFNQLKLEHWIVFPPKYNPRYCSGVCPRALGFIYGSPVHAMVQTIIYENLDSSVPRPSCIPSHYSPLSVMIFEKDGSYVYKELEDMIATRCTCR